MKSLRDEVLALQGLKKASFWGFFVTYYQKSGVNSTLLRIYLVNYTKKLCLKKIDLTIDICYDNIIMYKYLLKEKNYEKEITIMCFANSNTRFCACACR